MLDFQPSPAAARVAKVVRSATANAENELLARSSELRIVEIYANEGPRLKRLRARARDARQGSSKEAATSQS